MNTTAKLLSTTVIVAAALVGCTGTGLPGSTTPPTSPGFTGSITLNNAPVANREVFLKQYNGGVAGTFQGTTQHVDDSKYSTKTDSNGTFFLPVPSTAVSGGGLYGLGYDASLSDPTQKTADKNPNEILWFTTPAYNLADTTSHPGSRVSVSFDLGWAASAFSPKNTDTVTPTSGSINFNLPTYSGATAYEVDITTGNVAGTGAAAPGSPLKGSTPQLTWSQAANGTYNYEAKVTTQAGMAEAASPYVVFTVQ